MSHGRAPTVISFVDGTITAGVSLSGRAVSAGDPGVAAGFSFAGCATVGALSLTDASIVVGDWLAEFAFWPEIESYLSNSALHVPLSCGLCALRQPSILSMFPILLKQSRMTSPVHAARFSASDGSVEGLSRDLHANVRFSSAFE
jgi:hypothetical protein